ncbi:MAG: hypothetical protein AAF402_00285 [Pseudomonadota bacterium]
MIPAGWNGNQERGLRNFQPAGIKNWDWLTADTPDLLSNNVLHWRICP